MLKNEKILVVGAGGLLGARIVVSLLSQGAKVVAADINLKAMSQKLSENGIDVDQLSLILQGLDITNEVAVKLFFENQQDLTGAVNATFPRNKSFGTHFLDVSLESFNENLTIHLGSAFLFIQQCAVYFQKNKTPFSLVNFSSIYGVVAPKFEIYDGTSMTTAVEYAAMKSAIIHLNKYASSYIKNSKFRVNSVSPGGIFDSQPEAFLNAYKKHTNGTGMLKSDDLVGSVAFLLSSYSKHVTGQNIVVDDGFTL